MGWSFNNSTNPSAFFPYLTRFHSTKLSKFKCNKLAVVTCNLNTEIHFCFQIKHDLPRPLRSRDAQNILTFSTFVTFVSLLLLYLVEWDILCHLTLSTV